MALETAQVGSLSQVRDGTAAIGVRCRLGLMTPFAGALAVDKSGVMGQRVAAILAPVVPRRCAGFRLWLARGLVCAGLLAALGAVRCDAGEYFHRELNFRMWLPPGFEDVPGQSWPKGALMAKARFNRDGSLSRLVSVQDLGEVIRQDADLSRLKRAGGNVKQEKMRWRDFEVDVFSVTEGEAGMVFVSLNAQVPLMPRGVQVSLAALKTEERAVRQELEKLLESINGRSNWVSAAEREAAESSGLVRNSVTLAALVLLVGGALWGIAKVQG
jgi:hypothetical protein